MPVRGVGCVLLFLFLVALVSLPLPALAIDGGHGRWLLVQASGKGDDRQFAPKPHDGGSEGYDRRQDEIRQPTPYQQRLSPDERRQLRREVHDANRDLRPRRGDPRR